MKKIKQLLDKLFTIDCNKQPTQYNKLDNTYPPMGI